MSVTYNGRLAAPVAESGAGASVALTTEIAVSSSERALLGLSWYTASSADATAPTVSGWTLEFSHTSVVDAHHRAAVFTKQGPIAAGTTVTATIAAGSFARSLCGIRLGGVAATGYLDASAGADTSVSGVWGATITPTAAADVGIVGYGWVNFTNAANTPTAGYTEIFDFSNEGDNTQAAMVYKIVASASGAYTPGGNTNNQGNPSTSVALALLAGTPGAPSNTVTPVIGGYNVQGEALTCAPGTWTASPAPTYAYQWTRDATNISGATGSTYTLVSADLGTRIRCLVTATNVNGASSAISEATDPVVALGTDNIFVKVDGAWQATRRVVRVGGAWI